VVEAGRAVVLGVSFGADARPARLERLLLGRKTVVVDVEGCELFGADAAIMVEVHRLILV